MLRKELKLIIAFPSTSDAIAAEKACKENGCGGRLIPIPGEISAGCGLAWAAPVEEKEKILALLASNGISVQVAREMMI